MKPSAQSTEAPQQTAVLVAVINKNQPEEKAYEYLQELDFLVRTLNIKVKKHFTQKLAKPDTGTFIGSGKLLEIKNYLLENDADWVIFDDELSASQVKNINKELKKNILDRSLLILEIFERRAQTAQARTQVEMARLQYMLPRLTRMWTHLERQRGGTGTRGGAGEKEIETDRRVIKHQIAMLREKLDKIDKNAFIQRKSRAHIVRVAIVGYTNVGKSTLMNQLTKSEILAEDKLFATVDATVRKLVWQNIPFLLSDTVGFIRKLPHQLIESFKSTLDEVIEADVLLHVVDISHDGFEEHIEVVNKTLADIKAADKPCIMVFNKIDAYNKTRSGEPFDEHSKDVTHDLKKMYFAKNIPAVFISATQKQNIAELRETLLKKIKKKHFEIYPNYVQ